MGETDEGRKEHWTNLILKEINQYEYYTLIDQSVMVGCYISIFIKESLLGHINSIQKIDQVKCGFLGMTGNKGGLVNSLKINEFQLCFLNCHLPAGKETQIERLQSLQKIHERTINPKLTTNKNFCGAQFLAGDLNFRCSLEYEEALSLIDKYKEIQQDSKLDKEKKEKILQTLLITDQLKCSQNKDPVLSLYEEGQIKFLPTYKFDLDTNIDIYDTSKKKRTPSWCDRILIQDKGITYKQYLYESIPSYTVSDHKPVRAYYELQYRELYQPHSKDFILNQQQNYIYFYSEDICTNNCTKLSGTILFKYGPQQKRKKKEKKYVKICSTGIYIYDSRENKIPFIVTQLQQDKQIIQFNQNRNKILIMNQELQVIYQMKIEDEDFPFWLWILTKILNTKFSEKRDSNSLYQNWYSSNNELCCSKQSQRKEIKKEKFQLEILKQIYEDIIIDLKQKQMLIQDKILELIPNLQEKTFDRQQEVKHIEFKDIEIILDQNKSEILNLKQQQHDISSKIKKESKKYQQLILNFILNKELHKFEELFQRIDINQDILIEMDYKQDFYNKQCVVIQNSIKQLIKELDRNQDQNIKKKQMQNFKDNRKFFLKNHAKFKSNDPLMQSVMYNSIQDDGFFYKLGKGKKNEENQDQMLKSLENQLQIKLDNSDEILDQPSPTQGQNFISKNDRFRLLKIEMTDSQQFKSKWTNSKILTTAHKKDENEHLNFDFDSLPRIATIRRQNILLNENIKRISYFVEVDSPSFKSNQFILSEQSSKIEEISTAKLNLFQQMFHQQYVNYIENKFKNDFNQAVQKKKNKFKIQKKQNKKKYIIEANSSKQIYSNNLKSNMEFEDIEELQFEKKQEIQDPLELNTNNLNNKNSGYESSQDSNYFDEIFSQSLGNKEIQLDKKRYQRNSTQSIIALPSYRKSLSSLDFQTKSKNNHQNDNESIAIKIKELEKLQIQKKLLLQPDYLNTDAEKENNQTIENTNSFSNSQIKCLELSDIPSYKYQDTIENNQFLINNGHIQKEASLIDFKPDKPIDQQGGWCCNSSKIPCNIF